MNVGAGEAVVRLLEQGSPGIIARFGIEADLVKILQHPTTSIACDCGAVVPGAALHPRYYGTFPRVLGRYVREQKALTLEDAVRKMSGLPAATIGMIDRGLLAAGMAADLVVFDPNTVADHATFEEPTLASEGIRYALVNGQIAVDRGTPTPVQAGRTLRRSENMPTRPMNAPAIARTAKGEAAAKDGDPTLALVAMNISQAGADRAAHGSLWVGTSSRREIEATQFGVLQTAPRW
jgi:hypothetical protein